MPPQRTLLCQYRYDPLDRLTSHTQSNTPERHRFYCKSRLSAEIQGAIGYSIVQNDDLLLAQQQRQGETCDTTLLATDLQRSVLHTLTPDNQRHPIAYSPYGHRYAESGLTSLLGFNGERPDPVTGHYLLGNGYRAFNPVLMRFNSPDSVSPFGKGGLNSYTYCAGEPINKNDPTGHTLKPILPLRILARQKGNKAYSELQTTISRLEKEHASITYNFEKETYARLLDQANNPKIALSPQQPAIKTLKREHPSDLPNTLQVKANNLSEQLDQPRLRSLYEFIGSAESGIDQRKMHSLSMSMSNYPSGITFKDYEGLIKTLRDPGYHQRLNKIRELEELRARAWRQIGANYLPPS